MIYLHVGAGKSIRECNIIGIFDMDTSTVSPITRKLLAGAEKEKRTESPSLEIPKSFILYRAENGETKVCFSQFSSASLFGRMGKGSVRQMVGWLDSQMVSKDVTFSRKSNQKAFNGSPRVAALHAQWHIYAQGVLRSECNGALGFPS